MKNRKTFTMTSASTLGTILVSTALVACAAPEKEESGSPSESVEVGTSAPAAVERACAKATEDWWQLAEGTAVPVSSEYMAAGLYEVKLRAGKHRYTCRATEDGSIRSVQGAGKRR